MTKKLYQAIKYLSFFILFVVLQFSNIGALNNFAFGLYFCLVWCGQSLLLLSPLFVASAFFKNFMYMDAVYALCTVAVLMLFYFMHFKFKKPLNTILLGIYAFLSQVAFVYFLSDSASSFFDALLSVFCGIVFMYCCIHFLQNILLRGIRRKFYVDELICGGVLITILSAGVHSLPYGEYISLVVSTYLILLSLFTFGPSKTIVVATLLGLGISLSVQNISYITRLVLLGVSASAMYSQKRIFSVLGVVLVDVIVELYLLPVHLTVNIICVSVGAFMFYITPKKFVENIKSNIISEGQNNALYGMLMRSKKALEIKLKTLCDVFLEMRNAFMKMVKNNYQTKDIIESASLNIQNTVCSKCPNRNDCFVLNYQETNYHLQQLCNLAYKRDFVNVVDAEPVFAKKCVRLPVVVSNINHNITDFKQVAINEVQNNQSRLMLAEQLNGVSEVFKTLSLDIGENFKFDLDKENEVIEELGKVQVLCTECLVFDDGKNQNVWLTIRSRDYLPNLITKVVSKVLNSNLQMHSTMHSTQKNYENLVLKTKSNYQFVYGCAGAMKFGSEKSGDTYSVLKLENNKVLFSICDGMGSGKVASDISQISMSLIESFYKAGFESDVTLKIVNGLLSQRGEDQFSAVDVGIVDLNLGVFDLYKVGAPCSFLKRKQETSILKSGALPLGIVREIKPHTQSVVLKENDYIVLVSDGVVDEMGNYELLQELINETVDTNPQTVANEILNAVVVHSNKMPKDDMTVLVGKIIKN